jgi:hypothetical protein
MNIKYDKFISLGESCFSAAALIIQQKRDRSYPFDWMKSTTKGLLNVIKDGKMPLDGITKTNLKHPTYISTDQNMYFVHDFSENISDEEIINVKTRYDTKFDRLSDVLNGTENVLFVRVRTNHHELINNYKDICELADYIREKYPNLTFNILYISEDKPFKHPNVIHYWNPIRNVNISIIYGFLVMLLFKGKIHNQPLSIVQTAKDVMFNCSKLDA